MLNSAIQSLKSQLTGKVILPNDSDYDEVRRVFPGNFNHKPAVIVCVANNQDVQLVINFAKENNLPLAVRSGGHSNAGHSSVDDGVVLDLRKMNAIEVDVQSQTAWVESGATASQVTNELDKHGFVLGFGDTGSVGVGGITLGGGIGFLSRKLGLTIDNVLAAEIVTADAKLLNVDSEHEPDLFWAIRGGGGNFGIVTRFKFKLYPLTQAYGGMMILPATPAAIASCITKAGKAPDEFSAIFNIMPAPPMPFLPPEIHGKLVVMALMMYAGDPKAGEKVVAEFRSLAKPLADMVKPMRYKEIFFPEDKSYHPLAIAKTMFMKEVDENLGQVILQQLNNSDAAMRAIQLRVLGGAVAKVSNDATAYAHRTNPILTNVATFYTNDQDYQKRAAWVDETVAVLDQGEKGAYVNFLANEGEARIHEAYPDKTWKRLQNVKKKFDPDNLFQLNQNIQPEV
jgi:FAD/FMN-containing dehydrogenase